MISEIFGIGGCLEIPKIKDFSILGGRQWQNKVIVILLISPPKTSKIIDFWHFRKFSITPRENWDPGDKSRYQVFQLTPKTEKVKFTLKLVFAKPIVRNWPGPLKQNLRSKRVHEPGCTNQLWVPITNLAGYSRKDLMGETIDYMQPTSNPQSMKRADNLPMNL